MTDPTGLVDAYVAVWNAPDPAERRRRIATVWAPDGTSRHRLIDASGHEAIAARVEGSWHKWVRDGRHGFRAKRAVAHHDAVKLEFVMIALPGGDVVADGLSFLILDGAGRVAHDLQFNPSADEASTLVERIVALANEPDGAARRRRLAELWTEDGALIGDTAVHAGHDALAAALAETRAAASPFVSAGATHAHHDLAKFAWRRGDATGTDLVVLAADGRIRRAYRFTDPA